MAKDAYMGRPKAELDKEQGKKDAGQSFKGKAQKPYFGNPPKRQGTSDGYMTKGKKAVEKNKALPKRNYSKDGLIHD